MTQACRYFDLTARLAKAGFDAGDGTKIVAQVKSLKQLAFASSYTPGMADETPLMNVLQSMLGAGVSLSIAQKACFRAVYHEAYAIVTSEMRQQVERAEEPTIRHLSQPERAERIQKQRARLTGITVKGVSEPSEAGCTRAMSLSMWNGRSVHRESRSCLVTPRRT